MEAKRIFAGPGGEISVAEDHSTADLVHRYHRLQIIYVDMLISHLYLDALDAIECALVYRAVCTSRAYANGEGKTESFKGHVLFQKYLKNEKNHIRDYILSASYTKYNYKCTKISLLTDWEKIRMTKAPSYLFPKNDMPVHYYHKICETQTNQDEEDEQ